MSGKVIKMYSCWLFHSIIDFKECQTQNKTQRLFIESWMKNQRTKVLIIKLIQKSYCVVSEFHNLKPPSFQKTMSKKV